MMECTETAVFAGFLRDHMASDDVRGLAEMAVVKSLFTPDVPGESTAFE
jgi:hypothetical protein